MKAAEELIVPFLKRFCENCKQEFTPAQPQIRLCPNCGGPPELLTNRQDHDTVRIYDLSYIKATDIVFLKDNKRVVVNSVESFLCENPWDDHGRLPDVDMDKHALSLWDLDTFTRIDTLNSPSWSRDLMREGLVVSVDDRYALIADGTYMELRLFDLESKNEVRKFKPQVGTFYGKSVCISGDIKYVFGGDYEGFVSQWELASGAFVRKLECERSKITQLALLSSGDLVTLTENGELCRWQVSTGENLALRHTKEKITAVIPTHDDHLLYSTKEGRINQWNPPYFKSGGGIDKESTILQVYTGQAGWVNALALTPDGKAVLAGGKDGVLRLIELSSGDTLSVWKPPGDHAKEIECLAISPDGRHTLVGAGGQMHLWEWKEPLEVRKELLNKPLRATEMEEVTSALQKQLIKFTIPAHCRKCKKDLTVYANSDGRAAEVQDWVQYLCNTCAEKEMKFLERNIGDYYLLQDIGANQGYHYYRAWHAPTCRVLILWSQTPSVTLMSEIQRMSFIRRMKVLQELFHPNIIPVLGEERTSEGMIYIVPPTQGQDLESLLEQNSGVFPPEKAVACILDVLDGLAYLHDQGFVHRYVTPKNMVLCQTERVHRVILNCFDLMKSYQQRDEELERTGEYGGALPYMPPEQLIDFKGCMPPVDLYAVGVTLYYLLTGKYSIPFPSPAELRKGAFPHKDPIRILLEDQPIPIRQRNPEIPEHLAHVIDKAVRKKAEERYQSAIDMKNDLLDAMGWGEPHPEEILLPIQTLFKGLEIEDKAPIITSCAICGKDITSLANSDGRAKELLGDVIYWCSHCFNEITKEILKTPDETSGFYFIKTSENINWLPSASRLAWQPSTGRILVVKRMIVKPDAQDNLNRYLQDLEILRQIRHQNLTRLVEFQSIQNMVWLSSAYVLSNNLWDEFIIPRDIPIENIIRMTTGLLNGLEMMFAHGYLHLNIHPWNVLIPKGSMQNLKLCLSDLFLPSSSGIIQSTNIRYDPKGSIVILFLPPERITNWKKREPVSDIYSLGQILHFMLTGQLSLDAAVDQHLKIKVDPLKLVLSKERIPIRERQPDIPLELAQVVDRAVDPIKENRFQSICEFKQALLEVWKIL